MIDSRIKRQKNGASNLTHQSLNSFKTNTFYRLSLILNLNKSAKNEQFQSQQ